MRPYSLAPSFFPIFSACPALRSHGRKGTIKVFKVHGRVQYLEALFSSKEMLPCCRYLELLHLEMRNRLIFIDLSEITSFDQKII